MPNGVGVAALNRIGHKDAPFVFTVAFGVGLAPQLLIHVFVSTLNEVMEQPYGSVKNDDSGVKSWFYWRTKKSTIKSPSTLRVMRKSKSSTWPVQIPSSGSA